MKIIIIIISFILLLSINLSAQFQYETIEFGNQISNVSDIYFANPNTGYVMGYLSNNSPKLYKTTDKGASWTVRKDFGNIQNISSDATPTISFINANTGWALIGYFASVDMFTNYCEMLKTNDGGATWSRVFLRTYSGGPTTTEIYGTIKFIDENTGYLIDRISKDLMKTTNGGVNWTTIKPVPDVSSCRFNVLGISSTNPLRLYLGGTKFTGGGINYPLFYVSNDGGASFQTIYDGTLQNGMKGINNITIVNNNNVDLVRLASNSKLFEYNNNPQEPFTEISTLPDDFFDLSFSGLDKGFGSPSNNISNVVYRTDNQGLNWVAENLPEYSYASSGNPLIQFGNILYINGIPNVTRKLGMNLSILYDNVNSSGSFSFDGANKEIPSSPTIHYLRGGNSVLNATPIFNLNETNEIKFYSWNNGSMNSYNNGYYFDNNGEIKASYKTKQKADNAWAINNANQTKAIRDTNNLNNNPLNLIHQVHESIGGIFYTRSTNGGGNWSSEEVVNYNQYINRAFGNRNPSITVKRMGVNPITISEPDKNVAVVWERFNNATGKTEILASERGRNIQNTDYEWKGYDDNTGSFIFTSFPSSSDFQSTPKIFVSSFLTTSNLYNSALVVPHLEKNGNNTKVIVSIKYQTHSYDLLVDEGDIKNLSVSSPYNYYGVFGLHMVYQKDNSINNIVYKKIMAGWDLLTNSIQHDVIETDENLGNLDGMRARFTPDISVQNGLPVVTYCGNYYDNRIIQYEDETVSDNMISLLNHTTITLFKTTNNGAWSEYVRFTGLNPQENPNVEGSKNAMAYLLSFRKNGSYFQYVKINGLSQYYCTPESYSETDAKFIRGSYIGQFGSNYNPLLLTLSNPDANSRYTIGQQSFSISNIGSGTDGYNNLDATIEIDNTTYSLTLGPIIASNTTYGFEDDTPPQTVHNPVEFNETMVSAVFSLSDNDTLLIGAHGKYITADSEFQSLKYHVDLVNAATMEIHRELFRDTINIEDSVGIEFLRGYIINNIPNGTDQFYVQMVVDSVDAEDGDYRMTGEYADDTPPEGDAPMNYKTKIFFENGTSSLTSGNQIPKNYELAQNFPNPFNPVTKISFALPTQGFVSLKIYDITGREIQTLVNEVKQAGYYIVNFNGSNLSSGVYFYRIQSGDFISVKRMVLLK